MAKVDAPNHGCRVLIALWNERGPESDHCASTFRCWRSTNGAWYLGWSSDTSDPPPVRYCPFCGEDLRGEPLENHERHGEERFPRECSPC